MLKIPTSIIFLNEGEHDESDGQRVNNDYAENSNKSSDTSDDSQKTSGKCIPNFTNNTKKRTHIYAP